MTITVHSMVKNEARFVWFSMMSVINYVDKILLWDTGSTDRTREIIQEILKTKEGKKKVSFEEIGEVDPISFTKARQQMLDQTETDWFMIVDGDEVWWEKSIKKVILTIKSRGKNLESIVNPYYNIVGDIFHYQEEEAGMYQIDDKAGHINIRAINRNIPGLHFDKPHGQQGLYDENEILIQDRSKKQRIFVDAPYMHFSNVIRSMDRGNDLQVPKRDLKLKYDLGIVFPKDFKFPEVFYQSKPEIVPSPWDKRSKYFITRAFFETPLRKIKRRLFRKKVGY